MTEQKPPALLIDAPRIGDWLRVDGSGEITVLTGRVELGQGNLTALLQIAADELNCDVGALGIIPAHTGLTPNEGFTAGSVSISAGGAVLRWAASALRMALLGAAEQKTGVGSDNLVLTDHKITSRDDKITIDVAVLVDLIDLSQPVVALAQPKPLAERWTRGRAVERIDLRDRMVSAPFVHDLEFPGMLYGQPVHPPAPNARLVDLDIEALSNRPGVVDVVRDGMFVGVVAQTPYAAVRAARWARANAVFETPNAVPADEIAVIAQSQEDAETVFSAGDVEAAGGEVFETLVTRPYLFHASIGPAAAVALWEDDKVTVWSHSQGVFQQRGAIAMALEISPRSVEVIHHAGAGCYGHNGADDAALDAVLLARSVPGRPVKVVWSRLDEFRSSPMGPGMATRITAKVDTSGKICAMDVVANTAPHANRPGKNGTPNLLAAAHIANPKLPAKSTDMPFARGGGGDRNTVPDYDIPNIRAQKRLVHALPYRTSSLRSLGAFLNVFAIETLMDDIAVSRSEDPVQFRLRHTTDDRARAVIEGVDKLKKACDAPAGEGIGWGIGYSRYKNNSGYCAVMVRVEVDEELRVTHAFCVSDIGEAVSPDGALNQIEGGIIQAVSWATKERVLFEDGAVAAESWLDYPILKFSEAPLIKARLIERMQELPLGAGEISQGPTVAAIGNAVRDALGVRVRDLPIDRDTIVKAMS